ncbi:MAG: lipopolysaccharide heptosyltransferase II [Deltaproteobacteria bacterium]|nr:lipopolysaccharide heptosyltransferase II [Deltaproteobacteria bacterium]
MNILIVRLSAIGDIVHTLAMVAPLKKTYPGCRITWLVEERSADLVAGYPGIDHVIISPRTTWQHELRRFRLTKTARSVKAFLKELRRESYDLVFDFQGLFKSAVLVGLTRGEKKIGFADAREGSPLFYHLKIPGPAFDDHALKRHSALLAPFGISMKNYDFAPLYQPDDEAAVRELLQHENIPPDMPLIIINPCTLWPTKHWPREKAAKLCARLSRHTTHRLLFTGSRTDRPYLEQLCNLSGKQACNLGGKTSLRELAVLTAKADFILTMDSGPMHIASAVGTPAVALFGPTAPWRTGPFGTSDTIIRKELPCSPCFTKKTCPAGHHRCMADITVEEVYKLCCNYIH